MLTVPAVADLAAFTGRVEDSYGVYADQALAQATLLFTVRTRLGDYPDDGDQAQLARNAILEMADRIYLEQPNAAVNASPFSSESIGSYSYSKGSVVAKAREGQPTGLLWWDLAIEQLAVAAQSLVTTGSISALDRDHLYADADGNRVVLGPADLNTGPAGFDINAELNPRPALG